MKRIVVAASILFVASSCSAQPVEVVTVGPGGSTGNGDIAFSSETTDTLIEADATLAPTTTIVPETTTSTTTTTTAETTTTSVPGTRPPELEPATTVAPPTSIAPPTTLEVLPECPVTSAAASDEATGDVPDWYCNQEPAEWEEHELAALVLRPGFDDVDWNLDVEIEEAEPADPGDATCGTDAPPTLDGLTAELESEGEFVVQMIGQGTEAEAQSWVTAFGGLAGCTQEHDEGIVGSEFSVALPMADDAAGGTLEYDDSNDVTRFRFAVARYGDVVIVLLQASEAGDLLPAEWFEARFAEFEAAL